MSEFLWISLILSHVSEPFDVPAGWLRSYWVNQQILLFTFLAELFYSLTGNILGLKSHSGQCADDMQMTCGWCVDDMRVRLHWRFQLVDDICHLHVVRRHVCHPHLICSTPHGLHRLKLSFYSDRIWLLNGICHKNIELFHFRII